MIFLDITYNLYSDKNFLEEIAPDIIAAVIAFALGAFANWFITSKERARTNLKESRDIISRFHLATEKYFLARIEYEKSVELREINNVYIKFSEGQEKQRFRKIKQDYILREQELRIRCHDFHAEMRSFGSSIFVESSEKRNELLLLVNKFAHVYAYKFDHWVAVSVYSNNEEALKLQKEYSDFIYAMVNHHLASIQKYLEENLDKNLK